MSVVGYTMSMRETVWKPKECPVLKVTYLYIILVLYSELRGES